MGKNSRVDQMPMVNDEVRSLAHSVELSRSGSSQDFSLKITDDEDSIIAGMYGASGANAGVKGDGNNDIGKHEHLLRSGPMGKCDHPFCSTCPSYFGYSEDTSLSRSDHVRNALVGGANVLRNRAATWSKSWTPGILNPHTKVVQRWNKVFCISSLIAIFVDPVFFFLLSVNKGNMCLVFNNTAAVAVTVVRTLTDTIHLMHICLQFRLAYVAPASKVRGAGELEDDPKKIASHYMQGWFILDLFTALPLPQILIWTVVKKMLGKESGANYAKNMLRVVVLLQNIPRSLRFFPLLIGRSPSGFVFETAWANFVINLLMYLLSGHVVGSCWYLFGLQRVNQCLENSCENETSPGFIIPPTNQVLVCSRSYLDCGAGYDNSERFQSDPNYRFWKNNSAVAFNCLSNTPTFAYGIYLNGVQVVTESNVIRKYIYSLFWGFQQISTLAGNQVPSTFPWEVLFTMGIVGLGLLLFALLIGNMQNFLQALGRRKLDMQLKRYDTEVWMKRRRLPISLRRRVRQAGRFKWAATGGVEERELLDDLPEDLQKDVRRYLCLDLVKKVQLFELLEENVLEAICERLYQKLYIEKSEIFRSRRPVERMLFVVRGKLESFGEDGSRVVVKEGEFCGEELLSWYIDVAGVSNAKRIGGKRTRGKYPLSSRTVKCFTSVEAFSLEAEDLDYITTHYKFAFKSARVQGAIRYLSLYWRTLAASRIQKAWRARQARNLPSEPSSAPEKIRRVTRFATLNRTHF